MPAVRVEATGAEGLLCRYVERLVEWVPRDAPHLRFLLPKYGRMRCAERGRWGLCTKYEGELPEGTAIECEAHGRDRVKLVRMEVASGRSYASASLYAENAKPIELDYASAVRELRELGYSVPRARLPDSALAAHLAASGTYALPARPCVAASPVSC